MKKETDASQLARASVRRRYSIIVGGDREGV